MRKPPFRVLPVNFLLKRSEMDFYGSISHENNL